MRSIVLLFCTCIISCFIAKAQLPYCTDDNHVPIVQEKIIGAEFRHPAMYDTSVFYSDWVKGTIVCENSNTINNLNFRYFCLKDQLIWMRKSDYKMAIVNKETIRSFHYFTDKNKPVKFVKLDSISLFTKWNPILTRVLYEGDCILYVWHRWSLNPNGTVEYNDKYILKKDGKYYHVRKNKHSFYKIFDANKKVVRKATRKHKFFIPSENEMIQLVQCIDKVL